MSRAPLNTAARRERMSLENATVTAYVSLVTDDGGFQLAVRVLAEMPDISEETGGRLPA